VDGGGSSDIPVRLWAQIETSFRMVSFLLHDLQQGPENEKS